MNEDLSPSSISEHSTKDSDQSTTSEHRDLHSQGQRGETVDDLAEGHYGSDHEIDTAAVPSHQLNELFNNVLTETVYGKTLSPFDFKSRNQLQDDDDDILKDNDDGPTQPVFPQPCDNFYLPSEGSISPMMSPPVPTAPAVSFVPDNYKQEVKKVKVNIAHNNTHTFIPTIKKSRVCDTTIATTKNSGINTTNTNTDTIDDQKAGAAKKSRPKRGQYRKYNHELLLEAVKAVQRGDMSVHRAGSHYGVPHSTLEYKVKERHLLRQKKPRESRGNKKTDSSSAAALNESADSRDINTAERGSLDMKPSITTFNTSDRSSSIDSILNLAHSSKQLANEDINANKASLGSLGNGLLMNSLNAMAGMAGISPYPPLPPGFPLGLSLPGLFGGSAPPPLPDPALLSLFAGYQGYHQATVAPPGSNTCYNGPASASELLKKLQAKVQQQDSHAHAQREESHAHARREERQAHAQREESHAHAQRKESQAHAQREESHTHAQREESHTHAQREESHTHAQREKSHAHAEDGVSGENDTNQEQNLITNRESPPPSAMEPETGK